MHINRTLIHTSTTMQGLHSLGDLKLSKTRQFLRYSPNKRSFFIQP